jgi:Zn finger protein HypA/HybF involved in hydrogenase expression
MSKYKALCYSCKKHPPEYVVDTSERAYHGPWDVSEYFALCKKCAMVRSILHSGRSLKIKKIRYYNEIYGGKQAIICTVDKYKGRLIEAYCKYI